MKNLTTFLLLTFCGVSLLFAQDRLITIERNGNTLFFTSVDSMIANTQAGDTVKFPGGIFLLPNNNWFIDHEIFIFGVGYRADSSLATSPTKLVGEITIAVGGDNGLISGVYISDDLRVFASNFTGSRCYINERIKLNGSGHNNKFYENVVIGKSSSQAGCVWPDHSTNTHFKNNIFARGISGKPGAGTIFSHNVFLEDAHPISSSSTISNISFDHNVFLSVYSGPHFSLSNCSFTENLFVSDWSGNFGNNTNVNNIFNQPQNTIFINQTGYKFDLMHDYRIQPTSPGYMGGGINQAGIFGGTFPMKVNGHPLQPRIIQSEVNSSTDTNGNLQVKFKVEAQNN